VPTVLSRAGAAGGGVGPSLNRRRRADAPARAPGARGPVHRGVERDDGDPRIAGAVERAQRGDRDAVRFLYVAYADNVYGYVLSIVRDEHDAEDVTQQVFLKLITAITRYEPRHVPFAAWMLRVSRNVALDHLRQRRHVLCEEVRAADAVVDERADDCRHALREALAQLPAAWRDVLLMRHLVGLSPGEIARCLDKSEAAVHGLHHRGRSALRLELSRLEAEPATAPGH